MKCDAILSNKLRCKNKAKSYNAKIVVGGKEIINKVSLCEVHVQLQQAVTKIVELQKNEH